MNCNIFYRISSESHPKIKIPGATKENCLHNFVNFFGREIFVMADNCHEPLLQHMEKMKLKIIESNLGNSGSFVSALELAVKLPPDDMVYFVEDDYIHKADAVKVLAEAIPFADYVTVYDHPDKYGPYYDGGEVSKVFRTKSSHWRFTQSTTMTFAAQVKTLQEDLEYWLQGASGPTPDDHGTFTRLGEKRGRTIAVSVPGLACHADLWYSGHVGYDTSEDWAVEAATVYLIHELVRHPKDLPDLRMLIDQMRQAGMTPLQQGACLEELLKTKKAK